MAMWWPMIVNVLGFQCVWLASVAGAAKGWWWAGPLALLVFAGGQLALSAHRRDDVRLLLIAAPLGFAVDSLWVQLGWMVFDQPVPWAGFAPVWIVAMWLGFALTLNHSLASLKARPLVAALLGLVGGPLAYWVAATTWGAVVISPGWAPYLGLALAWAVLTPLLLRLADRPAATPLRAPA